MLGAAALGAVWSQRDRVPMAWQMPLRALIHGFEIDHAVRIPMPDGTVLAASLYRPRHATKPLATVLVRTPYNRLAQHEALYAGDFFATHGYAVLVQDVRGKYGSGGEFAPWEQATADGAATLDWITRQPWSNGKVGTFGCSALGELQYALARARHPAHAAMIPLGAGGALGSAMGRHEYFGVFEGGVFQLATGFGWFLENGARDRGQARANGVDIAAALRTLPVSQAISRVQPGRNAMDDFLGLPLGAAGWDRLNYVAQGDRIDTPALVINTWGDQTVDATLQLAEFARRQAPPGAAPEQHVVIAAGNHCKHVDVMEERRFGELEVPHSDRPYQDWYLQWFDQKLRGRGQGLAGLPAYQFYVVGEDRWLSSGTWPPEGTRLERWHLSSGGRANGRGGDGVLSLLRPAQGPAAAASDSYRHDPASPVPSRGGPVCCTGNPHDLAGPVDQAEVEKRDDVLVYTSAPLDRPLRLAGPLKARLTVSSTAPDTDFVVRLVHVWPDGRATNIQEGALRARYRDGIDRPQLMQPGQPYAVTVLMRSMAYRLPAGHRLRLHVASSSFPRLERNLNTGGRNHNESTGVVARNTVHHGPNDVAYVELPVLDDPVPAR
ncbi:CocE/NonD family hydrolase [Ideonella sp. BN130291]|uniref:CocE/NonD family hydrolase n=1 Tax=Ideonella sp. BN130291 TaxID=3112940 RepID=UPI002E26C4C3|nr:CocE/NonD family hydrolase [Ideonella sp. BN130291]